MSTTLEPSAPPKRAFDRAVRHHLEGRLHDAEQYYREAIALHPTFAEACNNLGSILGERGETDEALALFDRAVQAAPAYGEAHHNIGLVRSRLGRHQEAHAAYIAACESDPTRADWANSLGNNCIELCRYQDALVAFDRAVAVAPQEPEFWNNRALALRGVGRTVEAFASLERALALDPSNTNALSNAGAMLREARRLDEAVELFERAVALAPNHAPTLANFAAVYELLGESDRVRELATQALACDPSFAEPYVLLANCALEEGKYAESKILLEKCLALDPANRNALWNTAILSLLAGDFEHGWRQFEARKFLHSALIDHVSYTVPEWDGSPLNGRTILIHTEQGVGDAIQFVRLVALLRARGAGQVLLECPYPLAPLVAGVDGVDRVIAKGEAWPPHDVHAYLMSLPYLLGLRLDTIPSQVPYLHVEQRPAGALINAPGSMLKVGIVWAGNPAHHRDRLRSIPLESLGPLFEVPGVAWYALQKGEGVDDQLRQIRATTVQDVGPHLNDFRDTAAVIDRLDLVISVDTSVAHLAGALGKPTWTLITHVPDFRWMLEREDSPWYPTMRLFRQPTPLDWASVVARVAEELRDHVARRDRSPTVATRDVPSTVLESATRTLDGRPRFDVWIPLARLADGRTFAAYEAELVGAGYDLTLRAFWDEALGAVDTFVDLTPGIGLTLMSVLTASSQPRVVACEPEADAADRLRALAAARGYAERLTVSPEAALPDGCARVAVRCETAADIGRAIDLTANPPDALWIVAATQVVPWDARASIDTLMARGFTPCVASVVAHEVTLDPVTEWDRPQDIVLLSQAALSALMPDAEQRAAVPAATVAGRAPCPIGIDWELRPDTGWGVYGINLALELLGRADVTPHVFLHDLDQVSAIDRAQLNRIAHGHGTSRGAGSFPGLMLHALGNNMAGGPLLDQVRGRHNAGVIFFEDTAFDQVGLARARSFDAIVAGSTWNGEVLRSLGLTNIHVVPQGVDHTIFHPAPASGRLASRFVVFSGGKLEYRKGQDLVVAAFRRFVATHPDAVLLTAWHNAWPHLIADLDLAGHVNGMPASRDGSLDRAGWLEANGIPRDAVIDVGKLPNEAMGRVVREANIALFPNRCEGGTNLVAMECMAAGIPTVVSHNTGHRDLVATDGCIPLQRQSTVRHPTRYYNGVDGWGESDVDEIVHVLERAYADRDGTRAIAARGADAMQCWSWRAQVTRLMDTLAPLLS